MSFILDALRKSEHERQRQVGPGIADIRAATARPGLPMWAMVLGGLLLINVLVVIALTLRGRSAEPATAAVIAPQADSSPTPATSVAATTTTSVPVRPPDVTLRTPPSPTSTQPSQASSSNTTSQTTRADEPTLRPSPKPSAAEESAESYASLPTIGDVSLQHVSLPELHLDLHVYARRPADRFVFLNTRKYREGGQTPDGTTIERITPDGVVLNHHGVRFLLPRQ